jgi:hypothetical protein
MKLIQLVDGSWIDPREVVVIGVSVAEFPDGKPIDTVNIGLRWQDSVRITRDSREDAIALRDHIAATINTFWVE